ncbi:hypothetical protein C0V82_26170 (plasmid) [Niveispirillum cyanobacteriorum]|uniref:Uncharacterized protein n=2 Tax=Niveispirillum cyanobacteriorum TaxID=1612173 RepID=A0A2K9NLH0_9PROT|nr:UPF0149 family protein [Niveispirillum cyanobacteriorum]AUN33901.1 hypothetical protein C0V82_26170 [Niveispirillum cyanobacteriorum]GGE85846.1 hypothetical protein GCM10011317_48780 [Niveispirillum cyanobacteriorum]
MLLDEIINRLVGDMPLSRAELAGLMETAVSNAAGITPAVIGVIGKATAGVYLLPRQQMLLHVGLQVLAAGREAQACGPFLQLLRRPQDELDRLLGEGCVEFATGVILGLWDGDADALFALASDGAASGEVRWSALQVLSRLVHDGRIERDRLVDLLDRFDRERLAKDGDAAWEGWQDAVLYLGLVEFVERVERAWTDGRLPHTRKPDQQEFLEAVAAIAADPGDDGYLVRDHVVPITDPMADLEWLVQDTGPSGGEGEAPDTDPAAGVRLSEEELDWLAGFLDSAQAPEATLSMEHLDGFFSALVAGPVMVPPSRYMPVIWGGNEGPVYDSMEQVQHVTGLLMRHWNTIAARLGAGVVHEPYLYEVPVQEMGRHWAEGFLLGLDLEQRAWSPMLRDPQAGGIAMLISALIADEHGGEAPDDDARAEIIENLPTLLIGAWVYWRDREAGGRKAAQPVRSVKTGRNDPCPCGSGKKFKKCCGAGSQSVH